MECYCKSKQLYSSTQQAKQYNYNGTIHHSKRSISLKQPSPYSPLIQQIQQLSQLWQPSIIPQFQYSEIRYNPLAFYKSCVSKNIPCIIKNTIQGDDIIQRWSDYNYLSEVMGDNKITTAITPDGFADSIKSNYFIQPYQMKSNFKQFLQYQEKGNGIQYIQNQNNSLIDEFQILEYEYPRQAIKFIGQNVFQKQPDASNFWMGRSQSVSSLHKDPYQNLYLCINGQKHFTLIPPHHIMNMQQDQYESSKWNMKNDQFIVESDKNKVNWISCNPDLKSDYEKFKNLKKLKKFHVVLQEGDMLYLPSLWYHQVSQWNKNPKNYIIAINHWFDMQFTQNHTLYELTRKISGL